MVRHIYTIKRTDYIEDVVLFILYITTIVQLALYSLKMTGTELGGNAPTSVITF